MLTRRDLLRRIAAIPAAVALGVAGVATAARKYPHYAIDCSAWEMQPAESRREEWVVWRPGMKHAEPVSDAERRALCVRSEALRREPSCGAVISPEGKYGWVFTGGAPGTTPTTGQTGGNHE